MTTSIYVMGDRSTEVSHPARGVICFTYEGVSNVLSVANGASLPQSGKAGGQMSHQYTYDALYRLAGASGTYTGADGKTIKIINR